MESISLNNVIRIRALLRQILAAIDDLQEWNKNVSTDDDYYSSPEGMKNLAASCMLLEAIGEGFRRIDKLSDGQLLPTYDLPWPDIIGIRNHIAHGYFDIDGEIVLSTIKNDLEDLRKACIFFLEEIK